MALASASVRPPCCTFGTHSVARRDGGGMGCSMFPPKFLASAGAEGVAADVIAWPNVGVHNRKMRTTVRKFIQLAHGSALRVFGISERSA